LLSVEILKEDRSALNDYFCRVLVNHNRFGSVGSASAYVLQKHAEAVHLFPDEVIANCPQMQVRNAKGPDAEFRGALRTSALLLGFGAFNRLEFEDQRSFICPPAHYCGGFPKSVAVAGSAEAKILCDFGIPSGRVEL
jgi:hypothetical protein